MNQIHCRKALWPHPSVPNDPLKRASPGIQPLAPPSPPPSLHIQYFYVLCHAANFCQVLHPQSGHKEGCFSRLYPENNPNIILLRLPAFYLGGCRMKNRVNCSSNAIFFKNCSFSYLSTKSTSV